MLRSTFVLATPHFCRMLSRMGSAQPKRRGQNGGDILAGHERLMNNDDCYLLSWTRHKTPMAFRSLASIDTHCFPPSEMRTSSLAFAFLHRSGPPCFVAMDSNRPDLRLVAQPTGRVRPSTQSRSLYLPPPCVVPGHLSTVNCQSRFLAVFRSVCRCPSTNLALLLPLPALPIGRASVLPPCQRAIQVLLCCPFTAQRPITRCRAFGFDISPSRLSTQTGSFSCFGCRLLVAVDRATRSRSSLL